LTILPSVALSRSLTRLFVRLPAPVVFFLAMGTPRIFRLPQN
jgi:hypothetical protein